jgi:hypothetical protein
MAFLEAFYYEVDCYDFDNEKIMFHNTLRMTNADRIWGALVKNYYGHLNTGILRRFHLASVAYLV